MAFTRRCVAAAGALAFGAMSLMHAAPSLAETADEMAAAKAVEDLRKAMVEADKAKLDALTAADLSYGHSAGVVETKAQFIDVIASKKTIYKQITLLEPSLKVSGDNAIARHIFTAETEADGKPGSARVGVLQVWQKQASGWRLLARQAFKV